jgi:DNA end-binding protein Ku
LVAIPVKIYSATESSAAIRFKWMAGSGARVRQHYVADPRSAADEEAEAIAQASPASAADVTPRPRDPSRRENEAGVREPPQASPSPSGDETFVERSTMLKGYEYEKGKFVLFTQEELKALEASSRKTIDIVSFVPAHAIDPIYYDKAYLLAPDKAGVKPYHLLLRAMHDTRRCALARWAFRSKEYVAQIRAADGGIVLQQLLYADEVRSFAALRIEPSVIADAELDLAKRLIEQISIDSYNPSEFVDAEKQRILAAVAAKIRGKPLETPTPAPRSAQVIDLVAALRASLQKGADTNVHRKSSKKARTLRESTKTSKRRSV